MDFGKVTEEELEQIEFNLPPDPDVTRAMLAKGKGNTRFYIGCGKWGRKNWQGSLYPPDTREKDFLKHYAEIFNSIEFSGFYYNLHSKEQVLKWKEAVPADFLFCPKFTQYITHVRRLKDVRAQVQEYLDVVAQLGPNLGPLFLMLHPQMGPQDLEVLAHFIAEIPQETDLFVGLRQEDWYASPGGYHEQLYSLLQQSSRGTVITDTVGRRDWMHMHLSKPECYIRFAGYGLHPTDYQRIDSWVERLGQWVTAGLEKCYFFIYQQEELNAPRLIRYFIERLNQRCGTSLRVPLLQEAFS